MARITTIALLLACIVAPSWAITEQEIIETLTARIEVADGEITAARAIASARLRSALTLADDGRDLNTAIAKRQLAADLAVAAQALVAAEGTPAQARGRFSAAMSQAMGKYAQAVGQVHGQWSQDCGAAYGKFSQEIGATLQTLQQADQTAVQKAQQALQSPDFGDMPPVVDGTLPVIASDAGAADVGRTLDEAIAAIRAAYRADIVEAFKGTDEELQPAIEAADPAEATRKVIGRLKIVVLDRHDQYASDVRAAIRKAALAALE